METGQGVFRGDVEIGSDDADRQLELGSKGLLVKNDVGKIIHDIPDTSAENSATSVGHNSPSYYASDYGGNVVAYFLDLSSTLLSKQLSGTYSSSIANMTSGYGPLPSNARGATLFFNTYILTMDKYKDKTTTLSGSITPLYKPDSSTTYYIPRNYTSHSNVSQQGLTLRVDVPVSYDGKIYFNYDIKASSLNAVSGKLELEGKVFVANTWV